MKRIGFLFAMLLGVAFIQTNAWSDSQTSDKVSATNAVEFSIAEIFLEQNFTDGDTEVVIMAKGGDVGLKRFWLIAPDGEVVYKFKSPRGDSNRNIGAREIVIESPEPLDLNIVLSAYPQGEYTFVGYSFDGQWLKSYAQLSHEIAMPATITFPAADSEVSRHNLLITWEPTENAASYLVELKDEASDRSLEVEIAADQNQFLAPAAWINPNSEYQVSVFVTDTTGNKTAVERNFFTNSE